VAGRHPGAGCRRGRIIVYAGFLTGENGVKIFIERP
jgi:hypothetical protein